MRTLATIILVATTVLLAQDAPPPAKKKGPAHTNLKVLPDENIGQIMMSYRVALGAKDCMFCHVPGDNASDDNPHKPVARAMMKMMSDANASLADVAKTKVTCYTCHRGKNMPESAPPPAQ